jgi:hypothetical protein
LLDILRVDISVPTENLKCRVLIRAHKRRIPEDVGGIIATSLLNSGMIFKKKLENFKSFPPNDS